MKHKIHNKETLYRAKFALNEELAKREILLESRYNMLKHEVQQKNGLHIAMELFGQTSPFRSKVADGSSAVIDLIFKREKGSSIFYSVVKKAAAFLIAKYSEKLTKVLQKKIGATLA